jgi:hypothetical protein
MSPAEKLIYQRIRRRAEALQPEARRRLLTALDLVRSLLSESEFLRAANEGSVERFLSALLDDSVLDPALAPLRALIDTAALDAARAWPSPSPTFDTLNPRVIEAVRQLDTRVMQDLKAEIRESVRQAAREGLEAGKNPRVVAARMRGAIGLAPNQEAWVANFRAELEAGDRSALRRMLGKGQLRTTAGNVIERQGHAGGKGLAVRDIAMLERTLGTRDLRPDQIDRMVEAYRRRLVAWNTETHTRSIALDTQRLAQRLSWQSAIDNGTVKANRLMRRWVTVGDSRVRPEHQDMDGTETTWTGVYPNGESIPGESTFNCRCIERIYLIPEKVAA